MHAIDNLKLYYIYFNEDNSFGMNESCVFYKSIYFSVLDCLCARMLYAFLSVKLLILSYNTAVYLQLVTSTNPIPYNILRAWVWVWVLFMHHINLFILSMRYYLLLIHSFIHLFTHSFAFCPSSLARSLVC